MDELFSCRNCIHNAAQSLNSGAGVGFCLKHDSVIREPERTTCKYLHRKDLPRFVVEEGLGEHAAEFATFSGMVDLYKEEPIERIPYSERYVWEQGIFDPLVHTLAQYYKSERSWVFVQALSGGMDGRRALAHAALVRRYMDRCGTWRSSYRLVLALVQELDTDPHFDEASLVLAHGTSLEEAQSEARWDVVFARLAGVQEYGFHAGQESLMWATDHLNGGLSRLDWPELQTQLRTRIKEWTDQIIDHARQQRVFFPGPDETPREEPAA